MRVLLVDDNPDHRELIQGKTKKVFPHAEFIHIVRRADLESALNLGGIDLVLTDYRLNWTDGLWILDRVRERLPFVPVVMVTDTGSEEIATEGMKRGLSDYVLKGHLQRLALAIKESLDKACLKREHEDALQRLKMSEDRHRVISELCSDYAYACRLEPNGSVVNEWATQAFTRITGYDVSELEGGVLWAVAHPEDRNILIDAREKLRRGDTVSREFRIVRKTGEVRWVQDCARPIWDENHERVVRFYAAGQDITEHKRAEEERVQLAREQVRRAEAEASERRYRMLAEVIPQIVWTARPDGTLEYFNQRWQSYTGMDFEASRGQGWEAAVHPEDLPLTRERWYRAVRTGDTFEIELRLRRAADHSWRWHLVRALPLRNNGHGVAGWFGTSTDIDDQKRTEEELRQAQKLESIGLLAGGVAHDFNNLLTGILGNTSLALEDIGPDNSARELLTEVVRASERAADLTRQLLAYSGKGSFFVQRLHISDLAREISTLVRTSIPKKVNVDLDLAADVPAVEADPGQIQQLIMNMVINGAEAIGDNCTGLVRVRTGVEDVDEAYLRRHRFAVEPPHPGRYVLLEVQDTGCGMDEQTKAQIFDPFFTTKFTGRGLGLAAVLGIVRSHKGTLEVESAPGQGATFRVLLPSAEVPASADVVPEELPPLKEAATVLVVDDEDLVRRVAAQTLRRYGYDVIPASDGREAVDLFDQHGDRISAVLLDVTMPVMSGEEVLPLLKARRPDLPVIASSGYSESTAEERFAGQGLDGFIQKPYTAAALAQKLGQVLADAKAAASGGGRTGGAAGPAE